VEDELEDELLDEPVEAEDVLVVPVWAAVPADDERLVEDFLCADEVLATLWLFWASAGSCPEASWTPIVAHAVANAATEAAITRLRILRIRRRRRATSRRASMRACSRRSASRAGGGVLSKGFTWSPCMGIEGSFVIGDWEALRAE